MRQSSTSIFASVQFLPLPLDRSHVAYALYNLQQHRVLLQDTPHLRCNAQLNCLALTRKSC